MRVLLVTSKPFLPQKDGGNVASYLFYKQLVSQDILVDYCTLHSEKHPLKPEKFSKIGLPILASFGVQLSINPIKAVLHFLQNKSYNLGRFENEKYSEFIAENGPSYDAVIFDSLYTTAIDWSKIKKGAVPCYLRSHNLEHEIWEQKAIIALNPFKRLYFNVLAKQIQRHSQRISSYFKGVFIISPLEKSYFDLLDFGQVTLLPVLAKSKKVNPVPSTSYFHFGAMNWQPNIESAHIYLTKIVPQLAAKLPEARFKIAGSFMDQCQLPFHSRVTNEGFVENASDFILNSGILLAPTVSGSGVRIKILEALSNGVLVVSTTKGAEGIQQEDFPNLIVCNDWDDFVSEAIELGTNAERINQINLAIERQAQNQPLEVDFKEILKNGRV